MWWIIVAIFAAVFLVLAALSGLPRKRNPYLQFPFDGYREWRDG
jgi:hypothetical protein